MSAARHRRPGGAPDRKVVMLSRPGDGTWSLAELVAIADRVPAGQVAAALVEKMKRLSQITPDEWRNPATLRELLIMGTLVTDSCSRSLGWRRIRTLGSESQVIDGSPVATCAS